MGDPLSASVGASFSSGESASAPDGDLAPFELVADSRDQTLGAPFKYVPFAWSPSDFVKPDGVYFRQLETARYGRAVLRLYAPAPAGKIECLNPLSAPEREGTIVIGPGMAINLAPSGYAGRQVVNEGRRVDTIREELSFSGSASARIRRWHDNPAVSVITASRFVDTGGAEAAPPSYRGGGWFRAEKEVYGTLVVEYPASYWRYRVFYDLPPASLKLKYTLARGLAAEWQDKDGITHRGKQSAIFSENDIAAPSITVVAVSGARLSALSFSGGVFRWEFEAKAEDGEGDDAWTETARETKTEKVYDPEDDSLFIEVDRMTEGSFRGADGRTMKMRLKTDG